MVVMCSVQMKAVDLLSGAVHTAFRTLLLLEQVINFHLALAWLVVANRSLTSCCIAYCCVLSSSFPFGLKKHIGKLGIAFVGMISANKVPERALLHHQSWLGNKRSCTLLQPICLPLFLLSALESPTLQCHFLITKIQKSRAWAKLQDFM